MTEQIHFHSHSHSHPPAEGDSPERFLEFIRKVSPDSDPTSVMLFGQVLRANQQLTQAAERHLGTAGLSWAKFRMLMNLQRGESHGAAPGMHPSKLSDMQGISRNTASALIASLEEDGFVSRELYDTDRRKFVIRLTPEGRKVLRTKLDAQFKFVTRCFSGYSAAERETFLNLLLRLNKSLAEKAKEL